MRFKNLMLIDDDEEDQEIFLAALNEISDTITCDTYNEASGALQILKSGNAQPDAIFLDLNMPVMNGQQFLMEIKKIDELKNIPVIIISTSSHNGTIQLTKELGAYDFVTKPNNFDNLVGLLKPFLA